MNFLSPKIIYLIGDGRSGSTIFSIMMGNHPDIESVGELYRWIEFEGYPRKGNDKEADHRFWKQVRENYKKNGGSLNFLKLARARNEIEAYKNFLKVFTRKSHFGYENIYRNHLDLLFKAVAEMSNKTVVMDSSRNMARALMVYRRYPEDVWIINLVRDPRGVVLSYMKKNIEQEYKPPYKSALHNLIKNTFSLMVEQQVPNNRFKSIRYEDLAEQPTKTLKELEKFLEMDLSPVISKVEQGAPLYVPHILDGNRVRDQEKLHLSFDQAWKIKLGQLNKALAIALTFPLFIKFKYYKNIEGHDTYGK